MIYLCVCVFVFRTSKQLATEQDKKEFNHSKQNLEYIEKYDEIG